MRWSLSYRLEVAQRNQNRVEVIAKNFGPSSKLNGHILAVNVSRGTIVILDRQGKARQLSFRDIIDVKGWSSIQVQKRTRSAYPPGARGRGGSQTRLPPFIFRAY